MRLITEQNFDQSFSQKEKDLYIHGIFLQSNVVNRNNRIYPDKIMEREVNRYINEYILKNRAIGELSHRDNPQPAPENASHRVVELRKEGNNYIGKALILNTPMGQIVKGLYDGGVQMGVSSRGLGTVKEVNGINEIQDDFQLMCIDIVSDPSAPEAFVNGVMEGVEWIYQNGKLIRQAEETKKVIESLANTTKNKREIKFEQFEKFLRVINSEIINS